MCKNLKEECKGKFTMGKKQRSKVNYWRNIILRLLILMTVLYVCIGYLASNPTCGGRGNGLTKHSAAEAQIEWFSTALDMYNLDTGKSPSQETGLNALISQPDGLTKWQGPYLKKSYTHYEMVLGICTNSLKVLSQ